MVKKVLSYTLAFYFIIGVQWTLQSRHIVGGELYYECLGFTNGDSNSGSRTFRIYMRLYRDVLGGGADFDSAPGSTTSASVTIFRGENGDIFDTQYLSAPSTNTLDLNPGNECVKIPPGLEVEDGLYTFRDIDLPIGTESYYIVYQRCCRTEVLTNITDPGNSGATYFIEISPLAQQICNNSPVFNDIPPFIICAQEEFNFDASANDAEGHRLEYTFCSPFLGGGPDNQNPREATGIAPDPDAPPPFQAVNFIGPTYSAEQPLGAASNFRIDPNTGMMTGIPVIEGQFVVGLCVREFDEDDNLISETRRDFQFLVADCERNIVVDIPSDAVQADGSFLINSCSVDQVNIENNSTQSDDVADFFWEFNINGDTQMIADFSPNIDFPNPGIYEGRFVITAVTGCMDTGIVQVNVIDRIQPNFEVTSDPCIDFTTQFGNTSIVPATSTATWDWDLGDNQGRSALFEPEYTYTTAGTRTVQLRAITDGICVDSIQQVVDFFPLPPNLSLSTIAPQGCAPQTINFSIASPVLTEAYSISWDFGDGAQQAGLGVSHTYSNVGSYTPMLNIGAPNGCFLDSTLSTIVVEEAPVADFTFSPLQPNSLEPEVSFTNQSQGASDYNWSFANIGSSAEVNPVFRFPDSAGTYPVRLVVTHPNGCTDTLEQLITLQAINDLYLPNAFSPNGDGVNDIFQAFGPLGGKNDFIMEVFDRWGGRVFSSTDPSSGWNGQMNNAGESLPMGVYVYYLTFKDTENQVIKLEGLVNLMR